MSTYGTPINYATDEASWRALPDHKRCECECCDWRGSINDLCDLNSLADWINSQDQDGLVLVPRGESPECRAAIYTAEAHAAWDRAQAAPQTIAAARAMLVALHAASLATERAIHDLAQYAGVDIVAPPPWFRTRFSQQFDSLRHTRAAIAIAEAAGIKTEA